MISHRKSNNPHRNRPVQKRIPHRKLPIIKTPFYQHFITFRDYQENSNVNQQQCQHFCTEWHRRLLHEAFDNSKFVLAFFVNEMELKYTKIYFILVLTVVQLHGLQFVTNNAKTHMVKNWLETDLMYVVHIVVGLILVFQISKH